MRYSAQDIRKKINERLPEGSVVTAHDEHGHFYKVMTPDEKGSVGNIYPSVTGKLQILKDESLINYKKNKVINWFFANFERITKENLLEMLSEAERVPEDILADASDIGTQIHDTRQRIFESWMATSVMPGDFTSFIEPGAVDIRLRSAIRALEKFCVEHEYFPVATEMFVYDHKLKVGGTLDDLGIMKDEKTGKFIFVLMDLKSSNQFKDHYFFQVSMYWEMFCTLVRIKPTRCFILKLSKEDGTYKIEDLKQPQKLAMYAHAMLKTNKAIEYIKALRKDNQKNVAEKIEL